MGNLSAVVQELKRERERAQKEVQRIDSVLAALGSLGSYGPSRHHVHCRSSENQSGAESAVGKAEGETQANDLSRRPQTNRGSPTRTLGKRQSTVEVSCLAYPRHDSSRENLSGRSIGSAWQVRRRTNECACCCWKPVALNC
jgi:hypothetical protein